MGAWDWVVEHTRSNARYQQVLDRLGKDRYTVQEAAATAGVHVKTLRKHIAEGKLPVSRPSPRKTWVHKADLASYLCRRDG